MNNNIESKSSSIANAVLGFGVLFGLIVIIIGLTYISDRGGEVLVISYISIGIGSIMSSVIVWSIISLLINISTKLDNKQITLCQHSINEIIKAFNESKKNDSNSSVVNKVDKSRKVDTVVTTSKVDKVDKPNTVNEIYNEKVESVINEHKSDKAVIGEVLSGNIMKARHILMKERGMNLGQASSHIDNLKNELNL